MRPGRLAPWLPYLFFLAVTIFLFQEFVFHGQAYMGDSDRLFATIPLMKGMARSLARNRLPLWDDLNLCGCPFASWSLNVFYPPAFLMLRLFPDHLIVADSVRLFIEQWLTFALAYLFFLKVWDDRLLAVFSSVAYSLSLSAIMIWNFPFSTAFAPMVLLYLLWDWPERSLAVNVLGLSVALWFQLLGTVQQTAAYFILFVGAVSLARTLHGRSDRRSLGRFALMWIVSGVIALMLSAPNLLPFLQTQRTSNRVSLDYPTIVATFQQPWFSPLRLILPYFMGDFWQFPGIAGFGNTNDFEFFPAYAGVAAFFFCLLALRRLRRKEVWPWALGMALVSVTAIRSPFAALPYLLFGKSPLLHSRMVYLLPIMMGFLAPAGIETFLSSPKRERAWAIAFVAVFTAAIFCLGRGWPSFSLWSVIPPSTIGAPMNELAARLRAATDAFAVLGAALTVLLALYHLRWISPRAFKLASIALLTCDLLYFARKHTMANTFVSASAWQPDNAVSRFLSGLPDLDRYRSHLVMGTPWPGLPPFSPIQPNLYQPLLNLDYGYRDALGYGSILDRHFCDLAMEGRPHGEPLRIPLAWYELLSPQIADLMSVKYYALPERPQLTQGLFAYADRIFSADGVSVFRKRRPVPRFHLACRSRKAATLAEALSAIRSNSFDPADSAVIEPASGPDYDGSACGRGRLAMAEEAPEVLSGSAELAKPQLLVVSETFNTGWRAWINGAPAPIRRVNYAFMGVDLPAGTSRVELRFRPPYFEWALALAAAAAAALAALGLAQIRRMKL